MSEPDKIKLLLDRLLRQLADMQRDVESLIKALAK
jgi:hypothetical protein